MKTIEQIESLKREWLLDPCWDIEDTDGFEDHREELKSYRERVETEMSALAAEAEAKKTVKTLVQLLSANDNYNSSENADRELQRCIEQGWKINHIDHVTYPDNGGDWTVHIIKRIVLLTREVYKS